MVDFWASIDKEKLFRDAEDWWWVICIKGLDTEISFVIKNTP